MRQRLGVLTTAVFIISLAVFIVSASGYAFQSDGLARAIEAQNRHTDALLRNPNVVGTASGFDDHGAAVVKIFTKRAGVSGLPRQLDAVTVQVTVTGELSALHHRPWHSEGPSDSTLSTTSVWPRPVPIGISTGNEGECSAGTIGARVTKGGLVYALSNNHVYALENEAPLGSDVLQPGRYDTSCSIDPANVLGTLSEFVAIVFSSAANNTVDAAIALSDTALLGNATPSNGYGTPKSATVAESVGLNVQKYGRTTGLTRGRITGINGTILVGYGSGTARFVNQIVVGANKPFIKAGDSGSLLVTDPGTNPVGLLFAGDSSGKTAIANPIDAVLSAFGITIDGN